MTHSTSTPRSDNSFFEIRLTIFAGSNQRNAFDKKALAALGFNEVDFDSVKAMLQTAVLPKEAFYPFLSIRKSVQDFLATKGVNHDLMGRIFNPQERIEIVTFLKEKQAEYELAKKEFLTNYSVYISDQLAKVENSAKLKKLDSKPLLDAVRKNQPDVRYYERKLEFRFLDLSIELDSEQWAEEIDKINSDIEARTVYETQRDAEEIRDIDNPRSKAKALLSLASRFNSLNFYVSGLSAIAVEVESLVSNLGGLKAAKAYEAKEALMLTGIAKQIAIHSHALVSTKLPLSSFMNSEMERIETMFADEEQETLNISVSPEEQLSQSGVLAVREQDIIVSGWPEDDVEKSTVKPLATVSTGAFAF